MQMSRRGRSKKIGPVGPLNSLDDVKIAAAKFKSPTDRDFWLAWLTFRIDWDSFYAWRRDNPPPWWSPIPEVAMTAEYGDLPKYDALLARYQALLAQSGNLGVTTEAEVPSQESAAEEALGDALGGLGEGLGAAGKTLGELGTYVVLGAVVVGGVYLLGPMIWKAARR